MITLNFLREYPQVVIERLKVKNFDATGYVQQILELDNQKRALQKQLDDNLARQNVIAKQIGLLFKEGKTAEAQALKEENTSLKDVAKDMEQALADAETRLNDILVLLPNMPHSSVPAGKSAEDNEIVYTHGKAVSQEQLLPHWEICKKLNILDFETGVKITGAGFPVYRNKGARLQRALINFFIDQAVAAGYEEVQVPYVVNESSAYATGQLPDKEGQMYFVNMDNLYLIPTAEVPVTNIYRNVLLKESDFPIRHCAYSACFRREAGSYGKDVRGLNRLHEFSKVEIVRIDTPEHSRESHKEMLEHVEGLLKKLELPYRILRLCGGDQSFTSAICYDFEVYSEAQKRWLEVSSVSNFDTYQANRLKCRIRRQADKKTELAHTLNGSALALPRIVAALLENNQTEEGIRIPKALQPYMGCDMIK